MAEGGVDDRGVGDGEDQFLGANPVEHSLLRTEPIVGGRVELDNRLQVIVVGGDGGQDALVVRHVTRWDEPMRVELPDEGDGWSQHQPARRASSRRRTVCMAGRPPRIM